MTLKEIRDEIKTHLELARIVGYQDTYLNRLINRAKDAYCEDTSCRVSYYDQQWVAGRARYTLQPDVIRIRRVEYGTGYGSEFEGEVIPRVWIAEQETI